MASSDYPFDGISIVTARKTIGLIKEGTNYKIDHYWYNSRSDKWMLRLKEFGDKHQFFAKDFKPGPIHLLTT